MGSFLPTLEYIGSKFMLNKKCLFAEEEISIVRQNLSMKLFDGYRKDFLPRLNESEPVKVRFDFVLITIKEVVSSLLKETIKKPLEVFVRLALSLKRLSCCVGDTATHNL